MVYLFLRPPEEATMIVLRPGTCISLVVMRNYIQKDALHYKFGFTSMVAVKIKLVDFSEFLNSRC